MALTDTYKMLRDNRSLPSEVAELTELVKGLTGTMREQRQHLTEMDKDLKEARRTAATVSSHAAAYCGAVVPVFVQNLDSGVWHKSRQPCSSHLPKEWRARCGWRFGFANVCGSAELLTGIGSLCPTCLPLERKEQLRRAIARYK